MIRFVPLLAIIFAAGCAERPASLAPQATPPHAPSREPSALSAPLVVPPPPSGLPRPYLGADMKADSPEQQAYARYLLTTTMFPDRATCEGYLSERMRRDAAPGSLKWQWVTDPFLAWGGIRKVGVVVGPVEYLYAITEAHLTWQDAQGKDRKSTFSCYVQYASQKDVAIWRAGYLKYGYGLQDGHGRHVSGPAWLLGAAPSGSTDRWEPGILYYDGE